MPHVIVKLASGRSDPTKARIAEAVTKAIVANAPSRQLLFMLNPKTVSSLSPVRRSSCASRANAFTSGSVRKPPRGLTPGARVFHLKFGPGTVAAEEGGKLTVDFDHAGRKMVLDSFVEPA